MEIIERRQPSWNDLLPLYLIEARAGSSEWII